MTTTLAKLSITGFPLTQQLPNLASLLHFLSFKICPFIISDDKVNANWKNLIPYVYTWEADQNHSLHHQSEQTSSPHHPPPLTDSNHKTQSNKEIKPLNQYPYVNCHRHNWPWWCITHFSCSVCLPGFSELRFLLHLNCCHPSNVIHCQQWLPVQYHKHRTWCIQFQKGIGRLISSSITWAITYFPFISFHFFPRDTQCVQLAYSCAELWHFRYFHHGDVKC